MRIAIVVLLLLACVPAIAQELPRPVPAPVFPQVLPPPVVYQPRIYYQPFQYQASTYRPANYGTPIRDLIFGTGTVRHYYVPVPPVVPYPEKAFR